MRKTEGVAEEINTLGVKTITVQMDLAELGEVQAGVARIKNDLGTIDILVNNAVCGIVRAQLIARMNKDEWNRDLAINLTDPFKTIKYCMPGILDQGWRQIINISSNINTIGKVGQSSYVTTRPGLIDVTKTAVLEGTR